MVCARIQCRCENKQRESLEMSASLTLRIRLTPESLEVVRIDSIDLDLKVERLKSEASKATNLPTDSLVLIHLGIILEDDVTLKSCGLKSGSTVYVLKKKKKVPPPVSRGVTEADIQEIVKVFKTFKRHPSYRSAFNRLMRKDFMENIISATVGLKNDPVAVAYLKDPELLLHMDNLDIVRRVAELHPALADAVSHIAATIREETVNGSSTSSGPFTYGLENLSDEEDVDSSQSSDSQPRGDSLSRQSSFSTITTSQLAAALASATGFFPVSPRVSTSDLPGTSGTSGSSSGHITSEMFDLAMQQAVANARPGTSGDSPSTSEISSDVEAITRRLSRQLVQMRELGLTDTAANLQALHATGGDVQAAIDLVFSGAMSSDTP